VVGALAIEQSGLREHERAAADRSDARAVLGSSAQRARGVVRDGRLIVAHTRHDDRVRARQNAEPMTHAQ